MPFPPTPVPRPKAPPASFWLSYTYVLWAIVLFDPQFILKVQLVLIAAIVPAALVRGPRTWLLPLLGLIACACLGVPFAYNPAWCS